MFDELASLLRKYAEGTRTRSGFSELELFLARQRQDTRFDPEDMVPDLIRLLMLPEAKNEHFAMGINLIVQKTGCRSGDLRDAIEKRVIDDGADLDPRSQFELASALLFTGGDWTPQMLQQLQGLRASLPELWLDLAIAAYPFDTEGLAEAVAGLLSDDGGGIRWTALKPRYLKLVNATHTPSFNWFVQQIADSIPEEDRDDFIEWINGKRGSRLHYGPARVQPTTPMQIRSLRDDIEFLTARGSLAEPVAQSEMEAA